ncbi:unnamed protein product [Coregonus sp. 'balchen']|nr:unnamed protein product [Coregonus sp. 'balchen']
MVLLLLFYLVFYIFLGGMFVLTMYVMLLTLDDYKPTYQDRLVTPGMMIRPRGEAMEILYNTKDTESWDIYAQTLDNFLGPYNNSLQVQGLLQEVPERLRLRSIRPRGYSRWFLREVKAEVNQVQGLLQEVPERLRLRSIRPRGYSRWFLRG